MTVLIVNRNLGFVVWLGSALCEAGHDALPATDVHQAESLWRKLACRFDAVIIEPCLSGAAVFVERLFQSNREVRVFEWAEDAMNLCAEHPVVTFTAAALRISSSVEPFSPLAREVVLPELLEYRYR